MPKHHRPVQVLIKPASADCNLACDYCFYLKKAGLYPETTQHRMPSDVQEEMIRQILRYGGPNPSFAYQGGEPTLMGLDYFRRSVELQMRLGTGQSVSNAIQTNGILIDEEWALFLAEYKFLVGLSLDGPAHVHDHYRLDRGGHATHAKVERAAETMRACDTSFNILSVVSRYSASRAKEIYRYYRDLGCEWLQFIPAVEFDPATGQLADFSPAPLDYGRFMCEIFDEWKKDFRDGRPMVSVRLFDTLLAIHCGMSSPGCTFREKCGIYVVIEWNGDVYSCDFFVEPEWKLGNLMDRSLRTLIESPRQREFANLKADLPEGCRACEWLWLCHGGCTKDRMRSGNEGERGVDYFCESYKMIFEHTQSTFEELKVLVEAERGPAPGGAAKQPSSGKKRKKRGKR
jgi:serine-type anaerobic sulfatase-maturating enzyme